ncbi:MAG: creatininase family protein [Armatimonadetes bacterium]|nr:creatininase family protein [Armatimonadota bacterium]
MKWGELRSPALGSSDKSRIVVIPVAALEQHGQHLPVLTDTFIATELAERVNTALQEEVLVLPTLWLGASDHHLGFPGTMSLHLNTYVEVLCQIMECVIHSGFRKVFFLNGHGGNVVPGAQAINIVRQNHRDLDDLRLVFSAYWDLAGEAIKTVEEMETWRLTHACEYETSMVLFLRPELPEMSVAQGGTATIDSEYYVPDYTRPGIVTAAYVFDEVTQTGAMGRPDLGTPGKGEKLIEAIANEIVNFLRDMKKWGRIERGLAS